MARDFYPHEPFLRVRVVEPPYRSFEFDGIFAREQCGADPEIRGESLASFEPYAMLRQVERKPGELQVVPLVRSAAAEEPVLQFLVIGNPGRAPEYPYRIPLSLGYLPEIELIFRISPILHN